MFEREENPRDVRSAEIVVGIPSYKEAGSIAFPTQQASIGLQKYFPDQASAIINCDNLSPDGTEQAFLGTPTEVPKIYITTPPDTHGKGYNLENLFRKTLELGAKCLICVDADLTSITPEWIKYFAEPVLEGFDYVTPIYSRHKYDGTITNNICFPLIYSLFCRNIRQPIGGDFALSAQLIQYLIRQPWHRTTEEYGIDIFMSMNAVTGGFKICKTGLGAKHHNPSAPKLGPMFMQVISTAFLIITRNFRQWKDLTEISEPPLFGLRELEPPQDLIFDRISMEKEARQEFARHKERIEQTLSREVYSAIDRMFSGGSIDISSAQWATIVYDMIAAFAGAADKYALVEGLKGLYFGRTLSFINKTWDWSTEKAEEEILAQAECFYHKRGYLIEKMTDREEI